MKRALMILGLMLWSLEMAGAAELRVLTFNTWGIRDGRDKRARFELMPGAVAELGPDVVLFQEVFEDWEREALNSGLVKAGYPADGFRYFPLRSYGTGIYFVSRWPIADERMEPYESFRRPENKETLGRGMAGFRIKAPFGDFLVVTTHITPGNLADLSRAEGMLEFYELSKFIYEEVARTGVKNVIVGGDLNADPNKLIYNIFPALTGFSNAFPATHNQGFEPTVDRRENGYALMGIEAIDHIFFGNLTGAAFGLKPKSAEVVFKRRYLSASGKKYFLSDHFGVLAVFETTNDAPVIKDAPITYSARLSSKDKDWLFQNLRQGTNLDGSPDLWAHLAVAVLANQDRSKDRDAKLITAANKLLVHAAGNRGFKPGNEDLKILQAWVEKQ